MPGLPMLPLLMAGLPMLLLEAGLPLMQGPAMLPLLVTEPRPLAASRLPGQVCRQRRCR